MEMRVKLKTLAQEKEGVVVLSRKEGVTMMNLKGSTGTLLLLYS